MFIDYYCERCDAIIYIEKRLNDAPYDTGLAN